MCAIRNGWRLLDFIIVVVSVISLIPGAEDVGASTALCALQAFAACAVLHQRAFVLYSTYVLHALHSTSV